MRGEPNTRNSVIFLFWGYQPQSFATEVPKMTPKCCEVVIVVQSEMHVITLVTPCCVSVHCWTSASQSHEVESGFGIVITAEAIAALFK